MLPSHRHLGIRAVFRWRAMLHFSAAALGAAAILSCAELTGNGRGHLRVEVTTTGGDPDLDGFVVMLDSVPMGQVSPDGSRTIESLAIGPRLVQLSGVASNCAVVTPDPRAVYIRPDETMRVAITVHCEATGVRVNVTGTGDDVDQDGFFVAVGDAAPQFVRADLPQTIGRLTPGTYSVRLDSVATNCRVLGANPRDVVVTNRSVTTVPFTVECTAHTGAIDVRVTTSGRDIDVGGYQLYLNGGTVYVLPHTGGLLIQRVVPGHHFLRLGLIESNCSVTGGSDRTAEVIVGDTVSVVFDVRCAPVPVLAFSRFTYSDTRVYVMRVGGTELTDAGEGDTPSWAPDGTKFVMSRMSCGFYYCGYSFGLQVTGVDGAPITALTDQADFAPDWSPDGLKIAFTRYAGPRSELYVMNANGTAVAPLPIPGFTGGAHEPDWSPDGRHIVFACTFPTRRDICIVAADGTSFRRLTDDAADDSSPSWSPDGTTIAFATSRFSMQFSAIALMDVDGTNVRAVTEGTDPSWDPDGSRLAFVSNGPLPGIYHIGKDGSDRSRLTTDPGDRAPAWRP